MKVSTATIGMVAVLALAASAGAATITSGNFSLGYGYANDHWSTDETSATNSPNPNVYLTGDFTLGDVAFTGIKASNGGVGFADRVLGNNGTNNQSGYIGGGADAPFSATVTGSYTGPTPVDAAANPNYQVELNITAVKIYATQFGAGSDTVNWTETTVGNLQSQSPQAVGKAGVYDPTNYVHIVWNDPTGFLSPSGTTSQTRSFGLESNDAGNIALDGFEVFGNVVLNYDAVPEPASLGLLAMGGLLMIRRRRK
jgi:hypothetical protein